MTGNIALPRQTRIFIVLMGILQGALLYLVDLGDEKYQGPYEWIYTRTCLYTLALGIPSVMALSVVDLRDRRFWQHVILLLPILLVTALWTAWNVSDEEHYLITRILAPFTASLGLSVFTLLPFLQLRQSSGQWHKNYSQLCEFTWQNALTLLLAASFCIIFWIILRLTAELFRLLNIDLFADILAARLFERLATGVMIGMGILIGRTQQLPLRIARQILIAVIKGLLPVLALITLIFTASLPFNGLDTLWQTNWTAALLIGMIALMLFFVNTIYQDGGVSPPYPTWLRRVIDASILCLPVYSMLALYALHLRIDQYGWSIYRFWGTLLTLLASAYAFTYAWATLRPHQGWMAPIRQINIRLALLSIGLGILANTPLLDPFQISVNSQITRLESAVDAKTELDLSYLRFHSGRRGYEALQQLQSHPSFTNAAQAEQLAAVLRETNHNAPMPDTKVASVEQLKQHIKLASNAGMPGNDWWTALFTQQIGKAYCLNLNNNCVLLTPDLDKDGSIDPLLCQIHGTYGANCTLFHLSNQSWRTVDEISFYPTSQSTQTKLSAALYAGKLQPVPHPWPDLLIDGLEKPVEIDSNEYN